MLTNRWTGTALLILAFFAVITLQTHCLQTERRRAAILALGASNLVAERDSTRNLAVETEAVSHLLGGSLHAFGKLVIQTTQQRDALDDALGTERMAKYAMVFHVDTPNAAAPMVTSDTINIATTSPSVRSHTLPTRTSGFQCHPIRRDCVCVCPWIPSASSPKWNAPPRTQTAFVLLRS